MRRQFEFAVVVIVIAVLAVLAMQALLRARGEVEEASVQAEAAAIRAQLMERLAHRATFGGPLPASDNPVDWIRLVPNNYRGALDRAPQERRIWYYDTAERELVYLYDDGHRARFRLSRAAGNSGVRGVMGGVGLLRLEDGGR
jgi:type II secretory pathway pseudopilin PulG